MEDKLCELEQIFNRIMNIPKKCKNLPSNEKNLSPANGFESSDIYSGRQNRKTDLKSPENFVSNNNMADEAILIKYNKFVQENLQLIKQIDELNLNAVKNEEKIIELNSQIKNLNSVNYTLKQREKEMKNTILKLKGSIRVLCRIKPVESKFNIRHDDANIIINGKNFTMNHIFDQKSTQESIFEELKPEIESIFQGYNICIFAYGQTGSGKTYTMEGPRDNRGLIFRSFDEIEKISSDLKKEGYKVHFSIKYIEIYNEVVRDLIKDGIITIVHDNNSVRMKNCSEIEICDLKEAQSIIENSISKRSSGSTQVNEFSSRSHAIFILKIFIIKDDQSITGSLCLIDLAGSERLSKSKAENERLKETQFINKSLSALGNVISAIKRKDKHIPFRDSKLTHVMQEYLSQNSRASMIVNINTENIDETLCSLRFASKVSECDLGAANRNVVKHI